MKLIMMTDDAYNKMFKNSIMIQQMADLIVDIQNYDNIQYIKSRYENPGLKTIKDLHTTINNSIEQQINLTELIRSIDEPFIKALWKQSNNILPTNDFVFRIDYVGQVSIFYKDHKLKCSWNSNTTREIYNITGDIKYIVDDEIIKNILIEVVCFNNPNNNYWKSPMNYEDLLKKIEEVKPLYIEELTTKLKQLF